MKEQIPYYPTLEAEIAKCGISKKNIAKELGITSRAFSNKVKGNADFWLQEVITIHSMFPNVSIEELFSHSGWVHNFKNTEKGGGNVSESTKAKQDFSIHLREERNELEEAMYEYCMRVLTKKEGPTEAEVQLFPVVIREFSLYRRIHSWK